MADGADDGELPPHEKGDENHRKGDENHTRWSAAHSLLPVRVDGTCLRVTVGVGSLTVRPVPRIPYPFSSQHARSQARNQSTGSRLRYNLNRVRRARDVASPERF